jgi:hypothetical protein
MYYSSYLSISEISSAVVTTNIFLVKKERCLYKRTEF